MSVVRVLEFDFSFRDTQKEAIILCYGAAPDFVTSAAPAPGTATASVKPGGAGGGDKTTRP
jgi:hypothetical protein